MQWASQGHWEAEEREHWASPSAVLSALFFFFHLLTDLSARSITQIIKL